MSLSDINMKMKGFVDDLVKGLPHLEPTDWTNLVYTSLNFSVARTQPVTSSVVINTIGWKIFSSSFY